MGLVLGAYGFSDFAIVYDAEPGFWRVGTTAEPRS